MEHLLAVLLGLDSAFDSNEFWFCLEFRDLEYGVLGDRRNPESERASRLLPKLTHDCSGVANPGHCASGSGVSVGGLGRLEEARSAQVSPLRELRPDPAIKVLSV
jgi:hypothetical protein